MAEREQTAVLLAFLRYGPMTQFDLARRVGVSYVPQHLVVNGLLASGHRGAASRGAPVYRLTSEGLVKARSLAVRDRSLQVKAIDEALARG